MAAVYRHIFLISNVHTIRYGLTCKAECGQLYLAHVNRNKNYEKKTNMIAKHALLKQRTKF